MPDDLGFDKLLADDGLVAHLLGRTRSGYRRELLYGPDLPVVLLSGGPGMGKGRLLRSIRDGFGPRVPTAHLDCGSPDYRERAAQRPRPGAEGHEGAEPDPGPQTAGSQSARSERGATRSETTEALRWIGRQFNAWEGDGGKIPTPRLYAGLAAVATSNEELDRDTLVREVRRHDGLLPPGSFWKGVLRRAGANYFKALTALVATPVAAPLVSAVLDELLEHISTGAQAALKDCYGAYPGAAGQSKAGLLLLAAEFQKPGEERGNAEGFLFRALREDVEAAYGGVRGKLARVGRPALLLDRADSALGRRLLKPVLEDRERGHHDRTAIFATARRADGGRFLYRLDQSERDAPAAWRPAEGGLPRWRRSRDGSDELAPLSRGVLLVRMPRLTREQQQRESARLQSTRAQEGPTSRLRTDNGIHRLSGGRPLFVTRLAEAALPLRLPDDGSDQELLDARIHVGEGTPARPVADVLLGELIAAQLPEELPPEHRSDWLDLLGRLSIAHDVECAQTLIREGGPGREGRAGQDDQPERGDQRGRDDQLTAYRIAELLQDSGWPHCPRHFIGDLGLRHLLMRRLYGLESGGAAWRRGHELLRDSYREAAADGAPDDLFVSAAAHEMHHHLAFADAAAVTEYLARDFRNRDTAAWCDELLAIADAPLIGPAGDRRAEDRRKRALGHAPAADDEVQWRIDRLLHAVWLCEDRTRPSDDEVVGALRRQLELLSGKSDHGGGVLTHVATEWGERAGNQQPLKACTCTRHIG